MLVDGKLSFAIPGWCLCVIWIHPLAFAIQPDQSPQSAQTADSLTDANFAAWRDCIRAKDSELTWRDLPWSPGFHDGLRKAAAENKPLLLWAMNGHPLGCT